jgi:hypothetical protein
MTMPHPNYHHCDGIAEAEYREGHSIRIIHGGSDWNLIFDAWAGTTVFSVKFCPFCGKKLPLIKSR